MGLLHSLTTLGQQTYESDVVTIKLPKAEKLTKEQIKAVVKSHHKTPMQIMEIGDFYRVGNVIVKLNSSAEETPYDHLERTKKSMDERHGWNSPTNYSSVIKSIHNNKVLITHSVMGDVGSYHCYIDNSMHTGGVSVVFEYSLSEEKEVAALLDETLKSIKFK